MRFESPANSLCVTQAPLSAAQADTLYSPAPGFAESEPCDRSSQPSVAGRHLHHARYKLHGAALTPCAQSLPRTHVLRTRAPDVWVMELNVVSCFNDSLITQKYGNQCDKQWSKGKIRRQTWHFFIFDQMQYTTISLVIILFQRTLCGRGIRFDHISSKANRRKTESCIWLLKTCLMLCVSVSFPFPATY